MDKLPSFGRDIFPALMPTYQEYAKLHEKNRAAIEAVPREEFEYGSHERQKLDLYTPAKVSDDTPILVFMYGGGLSRGDKRLSSPPAASDMVYRNIGYWGISRGFLTIVPDYRRTTEAARYPSGGEDIAGVVAWIKNKFSSGTHKLYIMGNSAGAIHTSTWVLEPKFSDSRKSVSSGSVSIQGAVLVSIPAHFQQSGKSRTETLDQYYGDRIEQDCAHGVLERAESPTINTLVVTGSLDPEDEILTPSDDFVKRWKSRFGDSNLSVLELDGHNHFSTVAALGTDIEREESLGTAVLQWMGQ